MTESAARQGERIPAPVRLSMARAGVQVLAARLGVRVLHIKGETVDLSILPVRRNSSDVDVIVDPAGNRVLHDALVLRGWTVYSTFDSGSSFGHAQTYFHQDWGFLDLHRRFPGIRVPDADAFEVLWTDHGELDVAGIACAIPGIDAQRALHLLNCARGGIGGRNRADALWSAMDGAQRADCLRLIRRLDAEVAFAAARGELDAYADRREYPLWKVITEGGSRSAEWWARIRAEPRFRGKAVVLLRAPLVNIDTLSHRLGRRPRPAEIVAEFFSRAGRAARELRRRGR